MFLLWFLRGQSAVHQGGRVSDIALCYRWRDRKDKTACWWVCSGEFKYVLDLKMLTALCSFVSNFPHRQLRVWDWWCITDNRQVFSSVLRPHVALTSDMFLLYYTLNSATSARTSTFWNGMSVPPYSCPGLGWAVVILPSGWICVLKPSYNKLCSDFFPLCFFLSPLPFSRSCPPHTSINNFSFSFIFSLVLSPPSSSHPRKDCGPWWLRVATLAQRSTPMSTGAWTLLVLRYSRGRRDCRRPSAMWRETCSCSEQQAWRTSMEAKE